jgi:hypothetical protein
MPTFVSRGFFLSVNSEEFSFFAKGFQRYFIHHDAGVCAAVESFDFG